ncbi:MAG TPA: serine hydrolase domain-containing protein [Dehalococcoidia bacterium]|nr:serine hydrolase domain-containing protein [Dehalococcoidia bacterium]
MTVSGRVEAGFEPVRDLLERQFAEGMHIGAGVCVYHRGRPVVDIWGGEAERGSGRMWDGDTMALCYSVTKGLTATCVHILADRGLVDYDVPVSKYWPEFASNGKGAITVRHVLTHQAGIPQLPDGVTAEDVLDWETMVRGMESLEPVWEPGTDSGYHALNFGWLAGEIVRRVDGRSVGQFFREEVAAPLGIADDIHIGTRPEHEPRIAKLTSVVELTPEMEKQRAAFFGPESLAARALGMNLGNFGDVIDSPAGHQAQVPAANGVMSARALARMYACLAGGGELDGVRLLSAERVRIMSERQTYRPDRVLVLPVHWSLGYMNGGSDGWPQGPRVTAFGHPGAGGSLGQCDPEVGLAFAFVTNALNLDLVGAGRTAALADAARACAEGTA